MTCADVAATANFLVYVKRYNSMLPAKAAHRGVIIHSLIRQIFPVPSTSWMTMPGS